MAEMSDFRRAQVGCVAVIGNRVVATGFSQQRTHPMQDYYNQFRDFRGQKDVCAKLHSEINCICQLRSMNIDASKVDLYIYRKCRSREHGIAFPCSGCLKAIGDYNIKNIFFTTDFGYDHVKIA